MLYLPKGTAHNGRHVVTICFYGNSILRSARRDRYDTIGPIAAPTRRNRVKISYNIKRLRIIKPKLKIIVKLNID